MKKEIKGLIGVAVVSLATLSVFYLPFQFTWPLYSLSFQYYKQNYFSASANAEILNGVKNITVTEHEGNKTVNVTKTVIVESYLCFSVSNGYSLPIKLLSVSVEGDQVLPKEIKIGAYETITEYAKLNFNATGKSYNVSFKLLDVNGSTHSITASASVVNVSVSSLSTLFSVATFAFLIGNFTENQTGKALLTFSVLNTGPTTVTLSELCFEGKDVINTSVAIEPYENYTHAVSVSASITFLNNYTVSFVFSIGNATRTVTETATAY